MCGKEHNALYEPPIGPLMFGPMLLRGRRSVNVSHLACPGGRGPSCTLFPGRQLHAKSERRRALAGANAAGLPTFLPRSKCDRLTLYRCLREPVFASRARETRALLGQLILSPTDTTGHKVDVLELAQEPVCSSTAALHRVCSSMRHAALRERGRVAFGERLPLAIVARAAGLRHP
jgi:hypothetical protein